MGGFACLLVADMRYYGAIGVTSRCLSQMYCCMHCTCPTIAAGACRLDKSKPLNASETGPAGQVGLHTPVDIRAWQHMHMGRLAHTPWPIKLVGGQVQGGGGMAMVSALHDSHMPCPWYIGSSHT